MTGSLAAALTEVGCPKSTAAGLAGQARIESPDGVPDAGGQQQLLVLCGHGAGFDAAQGDRESWDGAVEHVVGNVAADNAEANDRFKRGEMGWEPYWLLPDRQARRA